MSVCIGVRATGTHELVRVGAKDGFSERGEPHSGHGDLPTAFVGHACAAERTRDDLVAKADAW